jgi:L-aspartate oxidase
MTSPQSDVLIIGSGAAGLIAAIRLANLGHSVLVTTKDAVTESSSAYAQGGIAVPLGSHDSPEQHIQDTLKVGLGRCKPEVVEFYINKITPCVETLDQWGIPFCGFHNGKINEKELGQEGAHSERRILKVSNDLTGRALMKSLWELACRNPKISICQGTFLTELCTNEEGHCLGGVFQDINNNFFPLYAPAIILATGGFSSIYSKSTNPSVSTGDGIAAAYKIGAEIGDMELVQFHPTALDTPACFLLSEALRGEGALLVNKKGERFMHKYAPKEMELAQRSVVSKAVWQEIKDTGAAYLDTRHLGQDFLKARFPGIYEHSKELGFDLSTDLLPITPAAHFTIGGIKTDLEAKTNIKNLWAIGEVTNTGLHGADRLASNSLLECIVSGFTSADSIHGQLTSSSGERVFEYAATEPADCNWTEVELNNKIAELKLAMWQSASIERNKKDLTKLLDYLNSTEALLPKELSKSQIMNQLKNQLLVSKLVIEAAIKKEETSQTTVSQST